MKIQLCCLVNKVGVCNVCNTGKCDTHSFYCESCEINCYDCRTPTMCFRCEQLVCVTCLMVNYSGNNVCPLCYRDDQFNNGEPYDLDPYDCENDR